MVTALTEHVPSPCHPVSLRTLVSLPELVLPYRSVRVYLRTKGRVPVPPWNLGVSLSQQMEVTEELGTHHGLP